MSCSPELKLASHSVLLTDSRETVWEKLINWHDWPSWDKGMEWVKFDGPIRNGSVGQLKCRNGPKVVLCVTQFDFGSSYRSEFEFLGTKFIFDHQLIATDQAGIEVVFNVYATGASVFLIGNLMKPAIEKGLPQWMDNFKFVLQESGSNFG